MAESCAEADDDLPNRPYCEDENKIAAEIHRKREANKAANRWASFVRNAMKDTRRSIKSNRSKNITASRKLDYNAAAVLSADAAATQTLLGG